MSTVLEQCIQLVLSVFKAFVDFCFDTDYPGLVVSFGAVMCAIFMIELGFNYLDFFTRSSNANSASSYIRSK